jgi:hypothetical protein
MNEENGILRRILHLNRTARASLRIPESGLFPFHEHNFVRPQKITVDPSSGIPNMRTL